MVESASRPAGSPYAALREQRETREIAGAVSKDFAEVWAFALDMLDF
jgi:hypothetical protein